MSAGSHLRRICAVMAAGTILPLPAVQAQVLSDAIMTRGSELSGREHLDLYVAVPYRAVTFQELNSAYAAQFTIHIVMRDLMGRRVADTTLTRNAVCSTYAESQGASGMADVAMVRFPLQPTTVRYELTVRDGFSRQFYQSSDTVEIPDYSNTPELSSVLFLTDVEQRGTRFAGTPLVGGRVWSDQQLFAFFEYYDDQLPQTTAFRWYIADADGKRLGSGLSEAQQISERRSQHFVALRSVTPGRPGSYRFVLAAHPVVDGVVDTTRVLARRERSYVVPRSAAASSVADLPKAIRQMVYVADGDVIDALQAIDDPIRQQSEFDAFWKRLDPSPATATNEAFTEYYARVATANERFRSYAEGWQTDMGRVYIVYGEPLTIQQFTSQGGMVVAVRWTYPNNQMFTFEDPSGFGDYRLRSGFPPRARYEYGR